MVNVIAEDSHFYVVETERNTYVAATKASPFLCIEADTKKALVDRVNRALAFYEANKNAMGANAARHSHVERVTPRRVISSRELEVA